MFEGKKAQESQKINTAQSRARRFELVRYFTLAGLGMFVLVALALVYFERQQTDFFQQVKKNEGEFLKQVQAGFSRQQEAVARRDLLTIHEAGNVNLTRLFSNALWEKDFAPFVAKAQELPVENCRAILDVKDEKDGKKKPPKEKMACFAEVGKNIMAIKGFAELDAKVINSMKKSTVFKIKVFDLRGITVYSSEHAQIGEDKSFNAGWQSAVRGKPASEMTHRGKFSAFEGVVENRDLIGSYQPVLAPGTDKIVGAFEVYSDVTPFLNQIKATSAAITKTAADNLAKMERTAADNQAKVDDSSNRMLAIVLVLMAVLFGALFMIVRRADRIIAQQDAERQQAEQHLAQAEKMASLGQMVAAVAHQLNTPLAFSHNNVSMVMRALKSYELPLQVADHFVKLVKDVEANLVTVNLQTSKAAVSSIEESDMDLEMPTEMLKDTLQGIDQMREMVENLRDFTRLDRSKTAEFDLNKGLRNVAYIARNVISTRVQVVEEFAPLPLVRGNLSQLNQVFLNLITNAAQAIPEDGTITVKSGVEGNRIRVDVSDTGTGIPVDVLPHIWENYFTTKPAGEGTGLGLAIAKSIVEEHGGEITVRTEPGKGTTFSVFLPALA